MVAVVAAAVDVAVVVVVAVVVAAAVDGRIFRRFVMIDYSHNRQLSY